MQETGIKSLGWEEPLGKGIGYPLQYSWASLVAQMVKNPPAMPDTWVQSLDWEDPLEGEHGNPLQYSCLEKLHGQRNLAAYSTWGCRVGYDRATKHTASLPPVVFSFMEPNVLPARC